jgi:hypothetical protein
VESQPETDRQTDRQTDRHRHRQTDRVDRDREQMSMSSLLSLDREIYET